MRRLKPMNGFGLFARRVSVLAGSPYAFVTSVVTIAAWLVSGPFMGWSDTWQLWANTGTTIITFLMVFLIQSSQNTQDRDIEAKLDVILKSISDEPPCKGNISDHTSRIDRGNA
jgi:low affinity Fe/Cu permease